MKKLILLLVACILAMPSPIRAFNAYDLDDCVALMYFYGNKADSDRVFNTYGGMVKATSASTFTIDGFLGIFTARFSMSGNSLTLVGSKNGTGGCSSQGWKLYTQFLRNMSVLGPLYTSDGVQWTYWMYDWYIGSPFFNIPYTTYDWIYNNGNQDMNTITIKQDGEKFIIHVDTSGGEALKMANSSFVPLFIDGFHIEIIKPNMLHTFNYVMDGSQYSSSIYGAFKLDGNQLSIYNFGDYGFAVKTNASNSSIEEKVISGTLDKTTKRFEIPVQQISGRMYNDYYCYEGNMYSTNNSNYPIFGTTVSVLIGNPNQNDLGDLAYMSYPQQGFLSDKYGAKIEGDYVDPEWVHKANVSKNYWVGYNNFKTYYYPAKLKFDEDWSVLWKKASTGDVEERHDYQNSVIYLDGNPEEVVTHTLTLSVDPITGASADGLKINGYINDKQNIDLVESYDIYMVAGSVTSVTTTNNDANTGIKGAVKLNATPIAATSATSQNINFTSATNQEGFVDLCNAINTSKQATVFVKANYRSDTKLHATFHSLKTVSVGSIDVTFQPEITNIWITDESGNTVTTTIKTASNGAHYVNETLEPGKYFLHVATKYDAPYKYASKTSNYGTTAAPNCPDTSATYTETSEPIPFDCTTAFTLISWKNEFVSDPYKILVQVAPKIPEILDVWITDESGNTVTTTIGTASNGAHYVSETLPHAKYFLNVKTKYDTEFKYAKKTSDYGTIAAPNCPAESQATTVTTQQIPFDCSTAFTVIAVCEDRASAAYKILVRLMPGISEVYISKENGDRVDVAWAAATVSGNKIYVNSDVNATLPYGNYYLNVVTTDGASVKYASATQSIGTTNSTVPNKMPAVTDATNEMAGNKVAFSCTTTYTLVPYKGDAEGEPYRLAVRMIPGGWTVSVSDGAIVAQAIEYDELLGKEVMTYTGYYTAGTSKLTFAANNVRKSTPYNRQYLYIGENSKYSAWGTLSSGNNMSITNKEHIRYHFRANSELSISTNGVDFIVVDLERKPTGAIYDTAPLTISVVDMGNYNTQLRGYVILSTKEDGSILGLSKDANDSKDVFMTENVRIFLDGYYYRAYDSKVREFFIGKENGKYYFWTQVIDLGYNSATGQMEMMPFNYVLATNEAQDDLYLMSKAKANSEGYTYLCTIGEPTSKSLPIPTSAKAPALAGAKGGVPVQAEVLFGSTNTLNLINNEVHFAAGPTRGYPLYLYRTLPGQPVTDVQDILAEAGEAHVMVRGNVVVIEGNDDEVVIYNIMGAEIYRGLDREIPLEHGVYVVAVGSAHPVKVAIK